MEDIFEGLDLDLDLGVPTKVSEPITPVATATTQPVKSTVVPQTSAPDLRNAPRSIVLPLSISRKFVLII